MQVLTKTAGKIKWTESYTSSLGNGIMQKHIFCPSTGYLSRDKYPVVFCNN